MWQTLLLILGMVVAVVLTIAVGLALLSVAFIAATAAWNLLRRVFNPAAVARQQETTPQRSVPFFLRRRDGHGDMVTALAVSVDGLIVVSAGRDRTIRASDPEWNQETPLPTPFFPGEIALGDHPALGALCALGVFREDANVPGNLGIAIYDAPSPSNEARFRLPIPGVRWLFRMVWSQDDTHVRALAAVYDPTRPLAPNNDPASPNRLVLMEFRVGSGEQSDLHAPCYLPLPPELEKAASWQIGDPDGFALSTTGRCLACRTERESEDEGRYGIGVWDVDTGQWIGRWGGLEAMPHDLHAVTRNGDRVFSTRQDDPRRDHRNGGPEWYDGLYVWDANSPPVGVEARPRPDWYGGRGMVFNRDESLIAHYGWGGETRIIDSTTGTVLRTLKRPSTGDDANRYGHNVSACAFAEGLNEFVTGHADGQLWWWSLKDLR